jgi:hypothetical protein
MSELIGDAGGAAACAAASQPLAVREKPPISIYPQLKNVVSSVDLGTRIDLKGITMRMRNAEYCHRCTCSVPCRSQRITHFCRYNPKRFSAVTIRLREPKTCALVFESGKMVITGASKAPQISLCNRRQVQRARTRHWLLPRNIHVLFSVWGILRHPWYVPFMKLQFYFAPSSFAMLSPPTLQTSIRPCSLHSGLFPRAQHARVMRREFSHTPRPIPPRIPGAGSRVCASTTCDLPFPIQRV